MRHTSLAVLLLVLCVPAVSAASAYQWRDDQGVMHFTDNSDKIPERYLKRAKEIDSLRVEQTPATAPVAGGKPGITTAPAAAPQAVQGAPSPVTHAVSADQARLSAELQGLREGLEAKKKELDRLHHKWSVAKGRTPSAEEVEEFEKKRAKGKATFKDNPYVNRKPLSSPAPARIAYFKKLEEIGRDEERVRQLELELQGLGK